LKRTISGALILFGAALFLSNAAEPGPGTGSEEGYAEFRARLVELYNAGDYEKGALIIEKNYDKFPEKLTAMSYNMALFCSHTEDYERGLEYLKKAHDRGYWFSIYAFQGDFWASYRELRAFEEFIERNSSMKEEAQKTAEFRMEVALPDSFDSGKRYPLFIALHGGGENIEVFRPRWKSEKLDEEFIVAYFQSSQVSAMNGFSWQDQEITLKELKAGYEKVCEKYPVNKEAVLIGGFSSGGYGSLVATFFEAFPVRGFIILCPPMPDNITAKEVIAARERGVRGTIITTELDRRVPEQRRMADQFRENGLQYQFIITPDIGHWYPENFSEMMDQAIEHIRAG